MAQNKGLCKANENLDVTKDRVKDNMVYVYCYLLDCFLPKQKALIFAMNPEGIRPSPIETCAKCEQCFPKA